MYRIYPFYADGVVMSGCCVKYQCSQVTQNIDSIHKIRKRMQNKVCTPFRMKPFMSMRLAYFLEDDFKVGKDLHNRAP